MRIICSIMPGIACVNAPAQKAAKPNFDGSSPVQRKRAAPHTRRPAIMAVMRATYMLLFFFGSALYMSPATAPYAASSNAMQSAVGYIGGIPNSTERRGGATTPTASPQGQPHTKPQRSTGMCMGESIEPICGICPVKNGSISASARNAAANTTVLTVMLLFFMIKAPSRWHKTSAAIPSGKATPS